MTFNDTSSSVWYSQLSSLAQVLSLWSQKRKAYKEKYETERSEVRVIVKQTFVNIWESLIPSLQFMSPKSDLCEKCKLMKMDIQYTTQHEKKMKTTEDYLAYLKHTQQERDYYNSNITHVTENGRNNPKPSRSQSLFKIFESSRKVHLFGVCNTGNYPNTQQTNYIIDEDEMPDDDK
ncbi:hypothetical protein C1645_820238 [Glomus cerebriforme]|uniref:Uncharacterized protein n=1 Tax=Glomus cerebriforme TaxID=658196 RepID=A0A397TCW1_9GLOM|nr:hypothetical protein C1645_820238 [Glomus cerebriforme]